MKTKLLIILSLTLVIHAFAGSATWNLSSATNDWNTAPKNLTQKSEGQLS